MNSNKKMRLLKSILGMMLLNSPLPGFSQRADMLECDSVRFSYETILSREQVTIFAHSTNMHVKYTDNNTQQYLPHIVPVEVPEETVHYILSSLNEFFVKQSAPIYRSHTKTSLSYMHDAVGAYMTIDVYSCGGVKKHRLTIGCPTEDMQQVGYDIYEYSKPFADFLQFLQSLIKGIHEECND